MFKAEVKSETLKGVVNIISTLVDEVKFTVGSEGISLKAVDPAHVAMIELRMEAGAFESFSASDTEIGVDLDKIKDVLKLAGSGDVISMEQDEDHGRLVFRIGNITRRMNLVDTSSMSDPKVPQLDIQSSILVSAGELQKGIRAAETVSDHIALTADADFFELSCEGDTDSANLRLEASMLERLDVPGRVRSLFPLDYFSNLIKAVPADTKVEIRLDNDYPVKIKFPLADGNGGVDYLLAPRIESD
ncbi:MAG: proliferating cell nuclear antigen (pcna) [Thermoplasmatales archaeon]|nr:proliferating cell nuclear antigen (pcna) [Thermoplasmatales archaeon]